MCRTSVKLTRSLDVGLIVVESKRDQRVRDRLVEQLGHEGLIKACANLAGARRTYLPIERRQGVVIGAAQRLAVAARGDVSAHLEEIASMLGVRSCT